MRNASAALISHLNSATEFQLADLLTITLKTGFVIRTCSADVDLVWEGNTYFSGKPKFKRGRTRATVGFEIDTLNLTLLPEATDAVNNIPLHTATRLGYLDGATVRLEKAYISKWPSIIGTLIKFFGDVSDLKIEGTKIELTVKSALERLNVPFPNDVYQTTCLNVLFDNKCGLNRNSFAVNGVVSSFILGEDRKLVFNTNLTNVDSYFDLGYLRFSSGANAGVQRTIKRFLQSNGKVEFALLLPFNPVIGDSFTAYPGCARTEAVCRTKFNNVNKFRGQPYIPVPETTYG